MKEDQELAEFRNLMLPPDHWEEGFGIKAMIGALFVGLIMTPASLYMQLVIGADFGSAAQWVTIILFIEVARRSFTVLKRPEIYVLYYMAGASLVSGSGLLWQQFLVQSESMRQFGIADKIPTWFAPHSPEVLGTRSFFHPQWMVPIALMALAMLVQRLDHFGLGYVMYRLTSDVEKLPFPLAPVGAQGITALADASGGKETWRWRVFSFGAMLGLVFAIVYMALPAVSGAFLPQALKILPLPFSDMSSNFETFLPANPIMISFDLGLLISGMVLPFWAMVGTAVGLILTLIANPLLHHMGVLHSWRPGIGAIRTLNTNMLDFYFSFGLGLTAAIAVIGIWNVANALLRRKQTLDVTAPATIEWRALFNPPAGRGDFSLWIALGIYLFSTMTTIVTAYFLLQWSAKLGQGSAVSPTLILVLLFYGFIYTPIISYVSARMEGIVGMSVQIPFVREATFILTGYKGAAIWFAPFPDMNYGSQASYFRQTELTGTKITSMIKAEAFIFPIVLVATVVFSQFIWKIAPVPSSAFPFAEQFWELNAYRQGLIYSATLPGGKSGAFNMAFNQYYLYGGLGFALIAYMICSGFGLPILLAYGIIRGMDQSAPHVILPQFLGALLGRYYFARKFGSDWPQYRVVFFAGYSCGAGLMMMLALGLVFMSKSVFQSTF